MSRWAIRTLLIVVPLGLFALGIAARLVAAHGLSFPSTEPSAFYVGVARNLVEGRGIVTDVLFSYAVPPIAVPRPAFELWQPLASFLAAAPMQLLGPTFANAQLSTVVVGALVGPLTWLIALDVAVREELPDLRAFLIALTSGILAALLGPFLVSDASPESTTAFTVFALIACWLMPRALPGDGMTVEEANRGRFLPRVLLGVVLGLAYLARHEAVYLAPAYVLLLLHALGPMRRSAIRALLPTMIGGVLVVTPWLVRNYMAFGSPFPGQVQELAFLTRNEQLFAYTERPSLTAFLNQGPTLIGGHVAEALWRNFVTVLLVPAMPVGLFGLVSLFALRRSAAVRAPRALRALIISGLLTFAFTSIVFPVASAWGTYRHAAGPFLIGLIVLTMLGLDTFVAGLRRRRRWSRANAWLAPAMALAIAIPFAVLQVRLLSEQNSAFVARLGEAKLAIAAVEQRPGLDSTRGGPLVTDQPVRLSEATGRRTIVLPDEPPSVVWRLARRFESPAVVVLTERGRYPQTLLRLGSTGCFPSGPQVGSGSGVTVYAFRVADVPCGSVGSR